MPRNLFNLTDKVAVVTGSTRGIGKAIAEALSSCGAKVVISSGTASTCSDVAEAIRHGGGEAVAIPCSVSHEAELDVLVQRTMDEWQRIDILVCNAAVNPHYGSMAEASGAVFDKVMDTNVKYVAELCHRVIPQMAARKDGAVIVVSSIAGFRGFDKLGVYALSKAAEMQLARNLAVEWGRDNICVNCLAPGLVRTQFSKALWQDTETLRRTVASHPLGRIGVPEDVSGAAVFLASQADSFVTGQTIVIDGGVTIASG